MCQVFVTAVSSRDVPRIAAAHDNIKPWEWGDGAACANTDDARVKGIELPGDKPSTLAVTITAEGTDVGLHLVEPLAAIKAETVTVGGSLFVYGLDNTCRTLVAVAIDLVVACMAVVGVDAEEGGIDGTAIADGCARSEPVGL